MQSGEHGMTKKDIDVKWIIIFVLVLLGGAGLTAGSFCIYYLVKPLHPAIVAVICIVDFLYSVFLTTMLIKHLKEEQWLLKGFFFSFGYTALFVPASALFLTFTNSISLLTEHIVEIILSAFFTGPSIFIVLAVALLLLSGA